MKKCENNNSIKKAIKIILQGGVVSFKTDTLYGLSADATCKTAVERISELKDRDNKPMLCLISKHFDITQYVDEITCDAQKLIDCFWPGPLTIIFKAKSVFCSTVTGGKDTIGLRMPDDKLCLKLLVAVRVPLVSTSVNKSGKQPINDPRLIDQTFNVDLCIDSGEVKCTLPSTIIDCSSETRLLREGVVSRQAIEQLLGKKV